MIRQTAQAIPAMGEPALPERFVGCTVNALPEDSKLQRLVKRYVRGFWEFAEAGKAPVFLGKTQQWKTYAATVVLRNVHVRFKVRTMFVCCTVDLARLKRDRFSEDTQEYVKRMTRIPFLVMDDFANVRAKTFGSDLLVEVACARHYEQLPTLWTGNIATKDIVMKYGANFARRMQEGSEGLGVQF